MKFVALLLVVCFVVLAVAAPARPTISNVFHAQVEVSVQEGDSGWHGGGLYAFDSPNGKARTDYRLEDPNHRLMFIHQLDRYDLKTVYTIEENKCRKTPVTGSIPNVWAFVALTTYNGTATYRGVQFDEWLYYDTASQTTTRLAVLHNNASHPVFLSVRSVHNKVVNEITIIFLEFDTRTPADWVFYVPNFCNNATDITTPQKLQGDPAGVVYFANSQWNCANPACTSRVPAGTGQPSYACAEFAARSLAYGGYLPGLSATAPQSSYTNWKGYNLCLTTRLAAALATVGFHTGGAVGAASAVFGDGGDGAWSHACIGIGADTVDCHNNARQGQRAEGIMFKGINAVVSP